MANKTHEHEPAQYPPAFPNDRETKTGPSLGEDHGDQCGGDQEAKGHQVGHDGKRSKGLDFNLKGVQGLLHPNERRTPNQGDTEEHEGGFSPLGHKRRNRRLVVGIHGFGTGSQMMSVVVVMARETISSKGAHAPLRPWGNHGLGPT